VNRNLTVFIALLLVCGLFTFALPFRSFADDTKDVKDVKFACSHHGPMNMMLTLSLEKGDPRKVEIAGKNNGKKWFVTIDGKDAAAGSGGGNGDSVKVHSGDTITWVITDANHGVAFADQKLAESMLTFDPPDPKTGQPLKLEDLATTLTSDDWKRFGTNLWGTKPIDAVQGKTFVMVSCKVK
jgi:plastocyanin